jgi:very-short-patch-repair endonuclease
VETVARVIQQRGGFLRRRDLLPLGFTDASLRSSLARGAIFRVRHGWYSVPGVDERATRAVRVGGRLTALSALETYGIRVPRGRPLSVAVPPNANRLRSPTDRRARLRPSEASIAWIDERRGRSSWRVPLADALLAVLVTEPREIAIACCSAALNLQLITPHSLERIFDRAPLRCRRWMPLVSSLDESHGETWFRIHFRESGRECAQQVKIPNIGRFDFRVSAHVYVEIDGGQHDPAWTGDDGSSWEHDLERDAAMAIRGNRVLHFGYRQLYSAWSTILAAIDRAVADDAALAARRRRHPYRPRGTQRKRRRSAAIEPP